MTAMRKMEVHREEVAAALEILRAVAEMIQAVGQIPSGELYALLMGKFDIETYEKMISTLIGAGLIRRERSHMLEWIGGNNNAKA